VQSQQVQFFVFCRGYARAQEAAETPMKFPRNDVLAELDCILGNCAQLVKAEQADAAARNESPSTEPIRVSIICAGGNATLSEILAAHCFLVEQDPHLLASVEIRYYILPTEGVNDLANYIATCDAWYHRNVWTVTSHPQLLVPWLSRSDPQWGKIPIRLDSSRLILPSSLVKSAVENFVRHANSVNKLNIFTRLEGSISREESSRIGIFPH